MPVEFLSHMKPILPHFVESDLAIVGTSHQQFQSIHNVHTADVWLYLQDLVQGKVFVLLIRSKLSDLSFFLFECLFVLLVQH